jgi:hypothetical protein
MAQFYVRKYLGRRGYQLLGTPLVRITDAVYTAIP